MRPNPAYSSRLRAANYRASYGACRRVSKSTAPTISHIDKSNGSRYDDVDRTEDGREDWSENEWEDKAEGEGEEAHVQYQEKCSGDCFDFAVISTETANGSPLIEVSGGHEPLLNQTSRASNTGKDLFVYTELLPWQTRVLAVRPDTEGAIIAADLLVVDLIVMEGVVVSDSKELIRYDALSYCWGIGPKDRLIELGGYDFAVSSNLEAALKVLRKPSDLLYLWVDAICINQGNNKEKSVQVASMLQVFAKAARVHAWLGPQSEDSDLAMACLGEHLSRLKAQIEETSSKEHSRACIFRLQTLKDAIWKLYSVPWFRRTWIRQEIFAAKSIEVHYGHKTIVWGSLWHGRTLIERIESASVVGKSAGPKAEYAIDALLDDLRKNTTTMGWGWKASKSLFETLVTSQFYQATDPKDIVYSSLGMCGVPVTTKSSWSLAITVDYEKTLQEVLQDIAVYLLQVGNFHQMLFYHASYQEGKSTSIGLPSWVLDWQNECCPPDEARIIQRARRESKLIDHEDAQFEILLGKRPPRHPVFGHRLHYDRLMWITWRPLLSGLHQLQRPTEVESSYPHVRQFNAQSDSCVWYMPRAISDGSLELYARAINYVAELTDYTSDLSWFANLDDEEVAAVLEGSIFACNNAAAYLAKFLAKRRFDPKRDRRRLVVLGKPGNGRIALVPANTHVGDIVVAVGSNYLPLILSPRNPTPPSKLKTIGLKTSQSHKVEWQLLDTVVEILGEDFELKGPAFSAYVYYVPEGDADTELDEDDRLRNWRLPIQRFIIR